MELPLILRAHPGEATGGVAHSVVLHTGDGQRWASSRRVGRGFWQKLSMLTGMDEGEDRTFDLVDAQEAFLMRATTRLGDHQEGSTMTFESPIGTPLGRIRRNRGQAQAETPEGRLLLSLPHQPRVRPLQDASGAVLGRWVCNLQREQGNLLDAAWNWQLYFQADTNVGPGFAEIVLKLEQQPLPELRLALLGLLLAACVGYGNEGTWSQASQQAPEKDHFSS